jgi:hypothetical protein
MHPVVNQRVVCRVVTALITKVSLYFHASSTVPFVIRYRVIQISSTLCWNCPAFNERSGLIPLYKTMSSVIKYYGNVFSNKVANPSTWEKQKESRLRSKTCLWPLNGLINKTSLRRRGLANFLEASTIVLIRWSEWRCLCGPRYLRRWNECCFR